MKIMVIHHEGETRNIRVTDEQMRTISRFIQLTEIDDALYDVDIEFVDSVDIEDL